MDSNLKGMSPEAANDILNNKGTSSEPITQTPPATVPPVEPPAGTEPPPVTPPPVETPPPAVVPPVVVPGATPPPAATPPPPAVTPPAVDYAAITGGKFKTAEEFNTHLQLIDKLQQELNEARTKGPVFQNEKQKEIFDLLNLAHGKPADELAESLRIQKLSLGELQGQQLRFEAFLLRPDIRNSGLGQEDLRAMFMDDDEKLHGNPNDAENPPSAAQKARAQLATNAAKAALTTHQETWKNALTQGGSAPKDPAVLAKEQMEYRNFVQSTIGTFDGINLELSAQDPDGENVTGKLAFKLDPSTQLPGVVNLVSDPMAWWDEILVEEGIMSKDGKIDLRKFAALGTEIKYRKELRNAVYKQGLEDRTAKMVITHRNPPKPVEGPPPVPAPKVLTDKEDLARQYFKVAGT